jgi:Mg2+/Co2+ transporter CorC
VGEIRDEYDADEENLIQEVGERVWLVEGSMKLDDINDELGTHLASEDYDSIGGLVLENLDRLPEDNEEVILENGIRLKVQGIDQTRIVKVLMTLPEETPAPESDTPPAEPVHSET